MPVGPDELADLAPLLRRAVALDAACLTRLRRDGAHLAALVRLPFGVLAARTVDAPGASLDVTFGAADVLAWVDGTSGAPAARDAEWRGGVPPAAGWRRIDTVPDTDVRPLVHAGALTLKQAAEREGGSGAAPRPAVADALLDSVVLTLADGGERAEITLRTLSVVTRLGFLPRGSHIAVDVAGRWVRVAAAYGSVFAERAGLSLAVH